MAGTAVWLGIILGALLLLTLVAGMFKLWFNKRKAKKATEKAHREAAQKQAEREKAKKPVREGDLFGVRAIQNGYYGGITQARPASPAPSYVLAPDQAVVDWGKNSSANSSFVELPRFPNSRSASPARTASPLRMQPPDHLNLSNGVGGTYMPPLPSSRDNRAVTPFNTAERPANWVSPLDVHFSRPSTPQSQPASRPTSFLPKLNFPDQTGKSALVFSTAYSFTSPPKSEETSIVTTELSVPAKAVEATSPSPTASIFPQSRKARQSNNSFFHAATEERPSSRRSNKSFHSTKSPNIETFPSDLPVPLNNLPPATAIDPLNFPFDNREWNTDKAVIRDSIVSRHRVSLFQPGADPQDTSRHSRIQSIAASSIYSSRDSLVESSDQFNLTIPKSTLKSPATQVPTTVKSSASPIKPVPTAPIKQPLASPTFEEPVSSIPPKIPPRSRARSRSTSTHSQRSVSTSAKISRSHDSIRIQRARASSQESFQSQINKQKRRSKDRDALHFDPSSARRNRSGSIKGRKIDFDHPRESPFSNSNTIDYATSSHSSNDSMSSISTISARSDSNEVETRGRLPLPHFDLARLNVNPSTSQASGSDHLKGKDQFESRPYSQQSQQSIGDVYDAYYRNSTMPRSRSGSNDSNGSAKRPPPLRLGVATDTIMEMPSPNSGAASAAGQERFPRML